MCVCVRVCVCVCVCVCACVCVCVYVCVRARMCVYVFFMCVCMCVCVCVRVCVCVIAGLAHALWKLFLSDHPGVHVPLVVVVVEYHIVLAQLSLAPLVQVRVCKCSHEKVVLSDPPLPRLVPFRVGLLPMHT
jgi:hypothetical protein